MSLFKRTLLAGAAALLTAAVALGVGAWWLGYTDEGLRWALARAGDAGGRLAIEGAEGALAREVRFASIRWRDEGTQIVAREVRGRIDLHALLAYTARVRDLRAGSVEIALRPKPGAPPPDSVGVPLVVDIPEAAVDKLSVAYADQRWEFSQVALAYSGGPRTHEVRGLSAQTPWGRARLDGTMQAGAPFEIAAKGSLERREATIDASARIHPFASEKVADLQLASRNVNLRNIDGTLPHALVSVEAQGRSTPGALLAGTLKAENKSPGPLDKEALPVTSLAARFALVGEEVRLERLQARAAGGTLDGRGTLRRDEALFDVTLARIDLRALRSNLRATQLSGALRTRLRREMQAFEGTLAQDGMRLSANAVRKGDVVEVRSLRAEAGGGTLSGSGVVRLGTPLTAVGKLALARFDPSKFGEYPQGSISGTAEVSGTAGAKRSLAARWTVRDSTLAGKALASSGSATLTGERLHALQASARWGTTSVEARGGFGAPGETLAWTLSAPESPVEGFSGAVNASGTLGGSWKEPRVAFDARSGPAVIAGRVRARSMSASGSGTLARHSLALAATGEGYRVQARAEGKWTRAAGWEGRLTELANSGRYPLALSEPVALRVAPRAFEAGRFAARLGEGRLVVHAAQWRPGRLSTRGEFAGLPAAWIVVPAGLGERLRTTLLLDGEWAIDSTPLLNGRVNVRRASGDVTLAQPAPLDLGLSAATLAARFEEGRVAGEARLESRLGSVQAEGSAAGFEKASALRFRARLDIADIRALTGPLPAHVRVAGRASALLDGRGTLGEPEVAGSASADGLAIHYPPYGVYLEDGRLRATLVGDAVRIDELALRGGEGRFTAAGTVPLRNGKAASVTWKAEQLQLLNRPDMRLVVSGSGVAGVENRRVALQGRVRAESGRFERGFERLPRLDEDIVVAGRSDEAAERRGAGMPVDLDLLVELGERVEVREAGFDGRLKGEVHVSSSGGSELRAYGRIEAVDATFRAYGQKLAVDPGIVIFNGPIRNPSLQITAWRRNQQVEAGVRITGTLEQPRAELVSDPPLPEGAKLSWLVLGRPPSEVGGGADLAVLQTAAGALLSRGNRDSVPITTRIAEAFGLDELSLRGSSDLTSRVIALGKRLTDRIYVTYERSLGAVAENLVKVDLSLTDRVSVRAQTGTISGVGVYYRYAWD